MSTTTVRKQAPRLPQPASRYWKGKAPANVQSESEDEQSVAEDDEPGEMDLRPSERSPVKTMTMTVSLRDVSVLQERKDVGLGLGRGEPDRVAEEDSEAESEEAELDEDEDEEGEEEEEEEEEESEPEEENSKPRFRPVFVPKRARATIVEKEAWAQDSEDALKRKEQEAEDKRRQAHDMVADSIKRELAESAEQTIPDIDDTDGLEPEAEFEAWRLRELARIKGEKEEEMRREEEREEIERRRALPEEQRLREDMERANKSREEKPKGQQRFLQKYWHKGAFHQDSEILKRHDYTESTSSYVDMTLLPKVMQVKEFGKRGRTKYTHLLDQDTTAGNGGFGGGPPTGAGPRATPTERRNHDTSWSSRHDRPAGKPGDGNPERWRRGSPPPRRVTEHRGGKERPRSRERTPVEDYRQGKRRRVD